MSTTSLQLAGNRLLVYSNDTTQYAMQYTETIYGQVKSS